MSSPFRPDDEEETQGPHPRMSRLPVLGQSPRAPERRDAAENRARILTAARRLLETRPIQDICMDEVAQTAGVGKGTVYRRFVDRAALCRALLSEEAQRLQTDVLRDFGLPPGASWRTRIERLLCALLDFTIDHGSLLSEARAFERRGGNRYAHPAHAWQRETLSCYLARAVRAQQIAPLEPMLTADLMLAALDPDLWAFHLGEGRPRETARRVFLDYVRRTLGTAA